MYFPLGWPKYLQCPGYAKTPPKHVFCNHDRSLFGVLTDDSVGIWYSKPCVQIVCHTRSSESLSNFGANLTAEWKPDSSMIVVVTTNNFLIFHRVDVDASLECLYEQKDSNVPSLRRESAELFIKERVPPLAIVPAFSVSLEGAINRLIGAEEELVVATDAGFLCGVNWDGSFDQGFILNLRCLSFSANQAHLQGVHTDMHDLNVVDLAYSSLIDGFSVVFSDGKAAFISLSADMQKSHVYGIWATEISGVVCTAVNHKYQLLAYGLKSAEGAVYSVADPNGAFQLSHRLVLSSKTFQDAARMAGPVTCLCWTPDGTALAMAWEKGGLSLWSVFGALLMCTLSWDYGSMDVLKNNPFHISSMVWGKEGYNLWFATRQSQFSPEDNRKHQTSALAQMPFAKSALTTNPSMVGCECVFLQSEDRLFVSAGGDLLRQPHPYSEAACSQDFVFINGNEYDDERPSVLEPPSLAVGNKQWIIVPIPHTYLGTNWPIRYTALDRRGQHVAVAGKNGLAHYSFHQRRWKLFGNETQEKDFEVKGGLLWWKDFIVLGCYNHLDSRDEIRLYPQKMKLDNQFVRVAKVSFEVMQLSIFRDRLLVLLADSSLTLFGFQQNSPKSSSPHIVCLQQIRIPNLVFLPESVISVTLAALQTERGKWVAKDAESILMNVCGRLFLIQKDVSNKHNDSQNNNKSSSVYNAISIIASCVENMWASSACCQNKPHLTEALWLSCGVGGMQVWLPLFPRDGEVPRAHNFMSKRIMLPVQSHIYPLAVLFEDAVVLGAENDTLLCGKNCSAPLPLSIVSRTSQVYLHHILRELLRRNLGYHAWEIAQSCSCLPYFPHSLELLLHEVLEEEATSSQPIPDALLPRVIDFIREFPMFLQTVVQCARKTELALWPYLFAAVGNPKDLFQDCLHQGLLETAASYLIILQNLEKASVSRQYATLLLDSALYSCKWELAKDLVRFLTAIDPSDVETPPRASLSVGPPNKYCISHPSVMATTEDDSQSVGTVSFSRKRSQSSSTAPFHSNAESGAQNNQNVVFHKEVVRTVSEPRIIPRKRYSIGHKDRGTAEEFFIDTVLARHARRLLADGQIKELGFFSAHLDFYLVSFLKKERSRAGKVDDIVHALRKLHEDFQWPFPFASVSSLALSRENSGSSMHLGNSTTACSDDHLAASDVSVPPAQSLATNSHPDVRDSGYLSHNARGASNFSMPLGVASLGNGDSHPVEAHLLPRAHQDDGSLLTLDMSEDSSLWEDDSPSMLEDDRWTGGPLVTDLENLTIEMASKGNHKSEVQLRYLLQITLEAGCLDWSFLIAMVLRDTLAVMRVVNAARQPELPQDNVHHLLQGIATLDQWVLSECLGYRPFMLAIRNQVKILARIATTKPQMLKLQNHHHHRVSTELSRENSLSQDDQDPLPAKSKNPGSADGKTTEEKSSHGSDDVFSPSNEELKLQNESEEFADDVGQEGDGAKDEEGWSNQCCIS